MQMNQVEEKIIEQFDSNFDSKDAHAWDNHTTITWNYEGVDVIYFWGQKEGEYHVDISQLLMICCPRTSHSPCMLGLKM